MLTFGESENSQNVVSNKPVKVSYNSANTTTVNTLEQEEMEKRIKYKLDFLLQNTENKFL